MTSSSRDLFAELAASEGEPDIAPATEALRIDEPLPEIISGDLTRTDAFSITVGVSSLEPVEVSIAVEGTLEDIAEGAIGSMSVMISAPFSNIIVICKRYLLGVIILLSLS